MAKEVVVWQGCDGSFHSTKDIAELHDRLIDLQAYVDRNPLSDEINIGEIAGKEFMNWLEKNPRIYIQLLPEDTDGD